MPEVICSPSDLQAFARAVFEALGADPEVAGVVADHLITANLSGHDSHGVIRIPQYVGEAERGTLVPAARPEVLSEHGGLALIDAHRGFGHFAAAFAMDWCVARCRETGVAAAALRHSNHIGRLGEYAERAAAAGVVGVTTYGIVGSGSVVPFGARDRFMGTNPWSIGVPADGEAFFFDGATSALAEGKIRHARAKGTQLPAGAVVDAEGRPSTDPEALYAGGGMLPAGGELAGHKGYGFGLAAALLGGLAMIDDPGPTTGGTTPPAEAGAPWLGGVLTLAIDPDSLGGGEAYRERVGEMLRALRSRPPREGVEAVLVAGDPERLMRARRLREGIPVPERTFADLQEIGARYGVGLGLG